jgi:hypothetical protein
VGRYQDAARRHRSTAWRYRSKMTPIFRDGSEGPVADATEANDRYSREHR